MKPINYIPNTSDEEDIMLIPPLTLPPPSVPLSTLRSSEALRTREIYYDSDYDDLPDLEPNTNY
jgi:hypothetical protein